jgi:hypothetical protein
MLLAVLFLCIGFMIAVLYIDLVFDFSVLSYRRTREPLPPAVLDPVATYYRYITRNPYLLMLIMLTAAACILAQLIYDLVPRWVGSASLSLTVLNSLVAVIKVIPTAQRLASGRDTAKERSQMVHSMLPFHLLLLVLVLLLALIQLIGTLK